MKVVNRIEDIPTLPKPIALTIGSFDGVHLGHQEIIHTLRKLTKNKGTSALFTFTNHPSRILSPNKPIPLIISFEHRLHLLKQHGLDLVIALPFTHEFSEQPYDLFLKTLHEKLPFSDLVLGEGAAFGKDREGNADHLKGLESSLGFKTHYLKKERHHMEVISSQQIRELIQEGKLKKVKKRLGRPHSLLAPFHSYEVIQENEALYSWSYSTHDLCLLPSAVYGVDLKWEKETEPAIAFVRGQNTLSGTKLSLTVYFEKKPLKSEFINISFVEYLHKELDPTRVQSSPASLLKELSSLASFS